MEHVIYGLFDPSDPDKAIRYIGYTSLGVTKRIAGHLAEVKRKRRPNHLLNWLSSLVNRGLKPGAVVVEIVTDKNWQDRERFWIAHFPNLVNSTAGGEGLINPSEDVRRRIGIAVSANGYRGGNPGPHTDRARANIAAGMRTSEKFKEANDRRRGRPGPKPTEVTKEKIRQKKLGRPNPQTPEWTANIAAGHVGLKQSRETIEKRAKKMLGNKNGCGNRGSRLITDRTHRKFLKAGATLPDGWTFTAQER